MFASQCSFIRQINLRICLASFQVLEQKAPNTLALRPLPLNKGAAFFAAVIRARLRAASNRFHFANSDIGRLRAEVDPAANVASTNYETTSDVIPAERQKPVRLNRFLRRDRKSVV